MKGKKSEFLILGYVIHNAIKEVMIGISTEVFAAGVTRQYQY